MNGIRSEFTITKQASIAAALLAVVLSFAGTSLARNPQTTDAATPPQASAQVDPQSEQPATQDETQTAQPGAMSSQQLTDPGYVKINSKLRKEEKAQEKVQADEYACTPDTPTTSAACGLP